MSAADDLLLIALLKQAAIGRARNGQRHDRKMVGEKRFMGMSFSGLILNLPCCYLYDIEIEGTIFKERDCEVKLG